MRGLRDRLGYGECSIPRRTPWISPRMIQKPRPHIGLLLWVTDRLDRLCRDCSATEASNLYLLKSISTPHAVYATKVTMSFTVTPNILKCWKPLGFVPRSRLLFLGQVLSKVRRSSGPP